MPADRTMHFLWGGHLCLMVTLVRESTAPLVFHDMETPPGKDPSIQVALGVGYQCVDMSRIPLRQVTPT
jgi:hypothetical protein